jgi:predicted dehydrogenase
MNSKLKIGIVGTGFIAEVIANALKLTEDASLIAVASRYHDSARAFAQRHQGVRIFNNWQELVAWDGIDAIYVATPTHVREEICVMAANCHKHVLADKPFTSLDSLQNITTICKQNKLAFMDATHFVHHPRTKQLKQELSIHVGKINAINSAFFFPISDVGNIRFDPKKEPCGAIGDMAWYCMRTIVEFMPEVPALLNAMGFADCDRQTGSVTCGAGVISFDNDFTSTWNVGYNTGALLMNLEILGSRGIISMDDFVLDWAGGFPPSNQQQSVGFEHRSGIMNRSEFQWIATPSPKPTAVLMLDKFIELVRQPDSEAVDLSIQQSIQTQAMLDTIWSHLVFRV